MKGIYIFFISLFFLYPIKVEQSLAAPGERAGQVGYGVQYRFPGSIDFYINNNYLREIK